MGAVGDHMKGMAASAALYTALPDSVNQAKEAVSEMLPDNMKAAIGITSIAVSLAVNAARHNNDSTTE
jgi:hypothetical protein